MSKKIIAFVLVVLLVFIFLFSRDEENVSQSLNKKKLLIYFMGEKAGYEDYQWIEHSDRWTLSVKGEMSKPLGLITNLMTIDVDKEFKPLKFYFKGIVNGATQEIVTKVSQGEARNELKIVQKTSQMTSKISSDALFLPNGVFSPYVVLAKKLEGITKEEMILSAYIVPQLEVSLRVNRDKEKAHLFHLNLAGVKIELLTDDEGYIRSLSIPSQSIEVYDKRYKKKRPTGKKEREKGTAHELIIQGKKLGKGFYSLKREKGDILIKGETQQAVGQVSLSFQFEEKLSQDWNLKAAVLKGKVNGEEVELRGKVEEDRVKVFFKQGEKILEKQMPFSSDIIFSTENPLLDNLLLIKKINDQKRKKIYALSESWGSFYLDEPLLVPISIEREGEEILMWQGKKIKSERYFIDVGSANGGYLWADKDNVLKISFPLAAMDVYHQDYGQLKTKEIATPEITSDKYISEEVTYPSGGIQLAGTLTIPKNNRLKQPAVILISGSGPQDRNEDTAGPGGLKFGIFKQIAHRLSEDGIAVLRYDDRGVGKSGGTFNEAAHQNLIKDVQAGIAYLRARNDILEDRIALIGHSDGAIIAPRVAAEDPKIKAIVLLAGTSETGDKVNALVLIINGGKDKQVFPYHAQKLYQRLIDLNKTARLKIFPDLNHLLIPSQTGAYSEYAKQEMEGRRLSQELLGYLSGWLNGVLYCDLKF